MTIQDRNEVKSFVKAVRVEQDRRNAEKFVEQETGMSLASDTELTRLAGMETGSQANVIESISIDGVTQETNSDTKVVNIDLSAYAKKTDISSALNYKGSKDTFAELPASGNENGDVWNIKIAGGTDRFGTPVKAGDNVAYVVAGDGDTLASGWDVMGGVTDLSGYVETETGKALSTNDFDNDYKAALDDLIAGSEETFTAEDIASIFDDSEEEEETPGGEG